MAAFSPFCRATWPQWAPKVCRRTWREKTKLFLGTFIKYLTGIKSKSLFFFSRKWEEESVWKIYACSNCMHNERQTINCRVRACSSERTKEKKCRREIWPSVLWMCVCFLYVATSWESWRSVWQSQSGWLSSSLNMWVWCKDTHTNARTHIVHVSRSTFCAVWSKGKKELQKTKHRAPAYPLPYLFPSLSAANISPSSSLLLIRLSQAVFLQACTWLTDTHTWHAVWSCSLGWRTGQETPGENSLKSKQE